MPGSRPPWWLYLLAASFADYCLLLTISTNFPPEAFGTFLNARPEAILVSRVVPGSPAEAAGVRAGDREVAIDGRVLHSDLDWRVMTMNSQVGRAMVLEFERDGRRFTATHVPSRRVFLLTSTRDNLGVPFLMVSVVLPVSLVLALLVAFKRPGDRVALSGAWLLSTIACVGAPEWMRGTAATFRALPLPVGALCWPALLSSLSIGPILFTFFSIFPRPIFKTRAVLALACLPGAIVTVYAATYLFLAVYQPDRALGFPRAAWMNYFGPLSFSAYVLAGAFVLARTYRRLDDPNERRRVRLLLAGVAAGGVGLLHTAGIVLFDWPGLTIAVVLFLLLPVSFAYAIVRHRLFDLRLIIRQGLQYALARGVILSLVPLVVVVLAVDLLAHGDQPLIGIVRTRGWIYGALVGFAILAHARRFRWMDAIDRRFFRERYDARRLMREVVDDVKAAHGLTEAAPTVVARVTMALHPVFTALFVKEPGETHYRVAAAAPADQAPPPLSGQSKIVGLVRLLGTPLQVATAESGWLARQLPADDTAFLRQARIDLLVPVAVEPDRREALLALGPKQSEEPYSDEDLQMLLAIAASLGLCVVGSIATPPGPTAFGECPRCGRLADASLARCPHDGAVLITAGFARTLTGRYRLERRIGRGGMGTVYEATDTALERRVAVKVIREDLIDRLDAAQRFRHEARAAAAFTHPHVVTVHDYGVTDEGRAFLVMELLDGLALRDELRREGRLSAGRTQEILRGVCAAAEAAHRRQLIHRDLKPENIFLARAGGVETAKVLDFGIAKVLPSAAIQSTAETGSGVLVGTLKYMAPEQLDGGQATPLWDIWALAVVAYELLTGSHPLAGVKPLDWADALRAGRWVPIGGGLMDATPGLQPFFTRALSPDPAARPQSAQTFYEELDLVLRRPS